MTSTWPDDDAERIKDELEAFARSVLDQDVLACQTALVNSLLAEGGRDGWTLDDIENLYPDVDMAGFDECYERARDFGGPTPDPDPYSMDRDQLLAVITAASPSNEHPLPAVTDEQLRRLVIELIDQRSIEGLEEWQEAARDTGPVEVYEWWLVTGYLASRLRGIGEPVLDNEYGCWWGRTCTGQSILLDGTLQRIAASIGSL